MHDSTLRISSRHQAIRAVQPLHDEEPRMTRPHRRRSSKHIDSFRRHGGVDHSMEEDGGDSTNSKPVLSVIDTGDQALDDLNGEEKLAIAPLEAQGASGLSITLVSNGKHVAPLATGTPQALSPRPPAMAAAVGTTPVYGQGAGAGHSHAPLEMSDVIWPIAVGIMFAVMVILYTLAVSRSFIHALSSGIYSRGWFLCSSSPEISLYKASYALPVNRISRLRAKTRGFYNRFLLPTVSWIDLTVGQCIVIVIYLACITAAVFVQSGGPAKDVIRSGRISVAQLPLIFALATKNSLLSITGKSYEKLNFLHRFAGRSCLVCGLIHSVFYLLKLNDLGFLDVKTKPVQMTGVVAMVVSIVTLLTSLHSIRSAAYQFFMISHIVGWVALLASVYSHVPYAKPWIIASLVIMAVDFAFRLCKMRLKTATIFAQEGGVTRIEIKDLASGWNSGQHVWMRRLTAGSIHEAHPFSISNSAEYAHLVKYHLNESVPCEGLTLYSKAFGRWTRDLYEASLTKANVSKDADPFGDEHAEKESPGIEQGMKMKVMIDGPYGVHFFSWGDFETVMLVAGGSGITYILSALEDIVARSIQAKSTTRRIRLLFITRSTGSVESFLCTLEDILYTARQAAPFLEISVEVYESRTSEHSPTAMTPGLPMLTPGLAMTPGLSSPLVKGELHSKGIRIIRGQRPNLVTCLNHALNDTRPDARNELAGGVALVTCGPVGLISSARKAAKEADQNLAYRAGGIVVHSEKFGW